MPPIAPNPRWNGAINVWRPRQMFMPPKGLPRPGGRMKFTYTGIEVRDLDRAIRFYTEALGMTLLARSKIPATNGEVAGLRSKGSQQILELNWYPRRRYRAGSELDHLGFDAGKEDVDTVIDRLVAYGAVRTRPTEVRKKYIVGFAKDPDGIWLEVYKSRRQ
ncbi:MAG: VOC family protein [Methanobacteriota archaeon]|nr:MAG: VOC family protein [Euryarchaeota archaeon]